jgi:hypothetical protein
MPASFERCVIVVDEELAPGLAANAAAVLAVTLGATAPELLGPELVDGDGRRHPGLIDRGLPVLRGSREQLAGVAERAAGGDASIVALPTFGQQTTDYAAFRARLAATPGADVVHLALLVYGPKRTVDKLTGNLGLLR